MANKATKLKYREAHSHAWIIVKEQDGESGYRVYQCNKCGSRILGGKSMDPESALLACQRASAD